MSLLAEHASRNTLKRRNAVGVLLLHAAALAALGFVTFPGLIVFGTLVAVTGLLGFSLGFHRLLAHRSFAAPRPVELGLAFIGCLGMQTGPITWVAIHRYHHSHSDKHDDPHTPLVSLLWSHIVWAMFEMPRSADPDFRRRYASRLNQDPVHLFLEEHLVAINGASAVVLYAAGAIAGGPSLGMSLLLWGFAARIVYVWHLTALIASACHRWGYRNFGTDDNSRNLWWVALLGFGEGWHNNHHARAGRVNFGIRWYELDPTYWVFCCLEKVRLVRRR